MTKGVRKPTPQPRRSGERAEAVARPRPARRVWIALALFTILTTALLYVLYTWGVPLGETGRFVYRYSKVLQERLARGAALVPVIALFVVAARLLARPGASARAGVVIGGVAMAGLTAWTWWVPPYFLQQHSVNLLSPSHEGAFLIEAAMEVRSPSEYLRRFDRERLTKSVEEMRGTRVLSNTPGTTLLAYGMMQAFPSDPREPGVFEGYLLRNDTRPEDVPAVAYAMKFSIVLAVLWGASSAFAYLLGRQFLSPLGAGLFAVLVTFNPATANFVPGKDPAQLLTINAMLWAWFAGVKRKSPVWTAVSGGVLVIGAAWGLIHVWVALAALVATAWNVWREREPVGAAVTRYLVAPATGAVVVALAIYLATGWNVVGTLLAVSRRYGEVQQWIRYDRRLWFWIGLPLFLLFVSPVVYALVAARRRAWWRPGDEGWRILVSTVAVMAVVYLVGVTYELPRLWVAFVPLLALGAVAGWPVVRGRDGRRAFAFVAALIVVHCVTTVMHVAALDARESEFRLQVGPGGGGPRLFE